MNTNKGVRERRARAGARAECAPSLPALFLALFPALFSSLFLFLHKCERGMFAYENLEVYKKAYSLNQKIYRFLKENKSIPRYAKDQLGRASLSIMLNIAEGSAKFSNKDRKNFYTIARASTFECASLVNFLCGEEEISNELKTGFIGIYEEISKMLFVMIRNLREGSPIDLK